MREEPYSFFVTRAMALEDRPNPCAPEVSGELPKSSILGSHEEMDIKAEPVNMVSERKRYLSYSIERFINSYKSGDSGKNNDADSRIKFSVDNILRPDFGKCCSLKRFVSPPHWAEANLRTPELGRVPPTSEFPKKRRHSDEPVECAKEQPSRPLSAIDGEMSASGKSELWPAWVYCTRYSDRPSSGPRSRRAKKKEKQEEKRPRTAFSGDQLSRLKLEFNENRYLTERRRQDLAKELNLNEAQIKIWFQNKRAKMKKSKGEKNPLALQLMAQGLYNHSTVPVDEDEFLEDLASTSTVSSH